MFTILVITFVISTITLLTGFGVGSVLTPTFTLFYDVKTAVFLVSIVHLANNLLKFGLFAHHIEKAIFWRFGIMSVAGALAGSLLQGFFQPVWEELQVRGQVCKGYNSYTRNQEAKQRLKGIVDQGRQAILLYFGDLDPSGYHMFLQIKEMLEPLGVQVVRVALTREQADEMELLPFDWSDKKDARARLFSEHFPELAEEKMGNELDAIQPEELMSLSQHALNYQQRNLNWLLEA